MSSMFFHDVVSVGCNLDRIASIHLQLASGSRVELKIFGLTNADRQAICAALPEVRDRCGDVSMAAAHDTGVAAFAISKVDNRLVIDTSGGTYHCAMKVEGARA